MNPTEPRTDPASVFRSRIYGWIIGLLGLKRDFRLKLSTGAFPDKPDKPPRSLKKALHLQEKIQDERMIWRVSSRNLSPRSLVLYLHGGAYVTNIKSIHWNLVKELAGRTDLAFVLPDYPLAPTATWQEVYQFIDTLYCRLINEVPAGELTLMGDSAGAGLALGFTQLLKEQGRPLPGQLILISPWLDITLSNPGIADVRKKDRILGVDALKQAGKAYAGNLDPKDHKVSPIYGTLYGLPRISLFIGTHDLLVADARKFQGEMTDRGIAINYFEYPRMFHVWVAVTMLKEARQAIDQIADLLIESGREG